MQDHSKPATRLLHFIGTTLVLATCDPAAGFLASLYRQRVGFRLLVFTRSSGDALSLLNAQQADLGTKRDDLHRLEAQQGSALDSLQRMSRKADALLASALHDRSDVQARLAAQAAAAKATRSTVRSTSTRTTRSARAC